MGLHRRPLPPAVMQNHTPFPLPKAKTLSIFFQILCFSRTLPKSTIFPPRAPPSLDLSLFLFLNFREVLRTWRKFKKRKGKDLGPEMAFYNFLVDFVAKSYTKWSRTQKHAERPENRRI